MLVLVKVLPILSSIPIYTTITKGYLTTLTFNIPLLFDFFFKFVLYCRALGKNKMINYIKFQNIEKKKYQVGPTGLSMNSPHALASSVIVL